VQELEDCRQDLAPDSYTHSDPLGISRTQDTSAPDPPHSVCRHLDPGESTLVNSTVVDLPRRITNQHAYEKPSRIDCYVYIWLDPDLGADRQGVGAKYLTITSTLHSPAMQAFRGMQPLTSANNALLKENQLDKRVNSAR